METLDLRCEERFKNLRLKKLEEKVKQELGQNEKPL